MTATTTTKGTTTVARTRTRPPLLARIRLAFHNLVLVYRFIVHFSAILDRLDAAERESRAELQRTYDDLRLALQKEMRMVVEDARRGGRRPSQRERQRTQSFYDGLHAAGRNVQNVFQAAGVRTGGEIKVKGEPL